MSYEEYKRHFPNAKFKQYLEDKQKFQKDMKIAQIKETDEHELHFDIPIYNEDCVRWRKMRMGLILKQDLGDLIFYQNHINCDLCEKWLIVFKENNEVWKGIPSLWST